MDQHQTPVTRRGAILACAATAAGAALSRGAVAESAPGDADHASLPVAALEYRFTNKSAAAIEAVFSWNARNFMAIRGNPEAVRPAPGGFELGGGPGKNTPSDGGLSRPPSTTRP